MIRAVHIDGHQPIFKVTMRSKRYGTVTATHVVCKKPNADRKDSIYVVLCTNIPLEKMRNAPKKILKIYTKR